MRVRSNLLEAIDSLEPIRQEVAPGSTFTMSDIQLSVFRACSLNLSASNQPDARSSLDGGGLEGQLTWTGGSISMPWLLALPGGPSFPCSGFKEGHPRLHLTRAILARPLPMKKVGRRFPSSLNSKLQSASVVFGTPAVGTSLRYPGLARHRCPGPQWASPPLDPHPGLSSLLHPPRA